MNRVRPGSFLINMGDDQIDVFEEIRKTSNVPYTHILGPSGTLGYVEFSGELFDDIQRFVKVGGYAGITLAEFLDGLYSSASTS